MPAVAVAARPVAERRVTSVLFGDLVGFTTLSESRDPEEVREVLSEYFSRCRTIVDRYGGTVEKFIGDAVMAVWGVPTAHEDDAERAVRAGLELVDATAEVGRQTGVADLAMRVGIVTGEVAVTLGATNEGMVAGDAVNTAARVQAAARPGAVWTDEQTRRLTRAAVEAQPAGVHALKGKADPVPLFEVVAVMGNRGDSRRIDRVEAPLIGYRDELAQLKRTFHAAADECRGRLLVVSGEAGVGKSRLGWELEKYLDGLADRVRWLWGRCLDYGDGVALSALSAVVRARAGVEIGGRAADPAELEAAVDRSLAALGAEPELARRLAPRLAVLLGAASGAPFTREDLFSAWVSWFVLLAADGPVVWVVDDAHHADDALLDFLEHLVAVADVPLLVVVLTRPELLVRRPRLGGSRHADVLRVAGLPALAMGGLVDRLVPGLPAAVVEQLAGRAEGVPLYAVEAVRSMLDHGLLVEVDGTRTLAGGVQPSALLTAGAPPSLRILVTSRLDLLEPGQRGLLGTAAVLGGSFGLASLGALTASSAGELTARLAPLVQRDLLRIVPGSLSAELGDYAFVQQLVQQVAYQTQARRDRAELHLLAARHMQTLVAGDGELTTLVAEHLRSALEMLPSLDGRRAELSDELVEWLLRAADRARSVGALAEALAGWDAVLERVDDPVRAAPVRLAAATVANIAARFDLAVGYTDPLLAEGHPAVDPDLLADALAQRSKALRNTGHAGTAHELLSAWRAGRVDLSPAADSAITRELAVALQQLGRREDAAPAAEQAVRLAEQSGRPDLLVLAMNIAANGYDDNGLPHLAAAAYRAAADLARDHDLLAERTMVLGNLAAVELNRDPATGIAAAFDAIELATEIGDAYSVVGAAGNVAEMLRGVGRWDDVAALLDLPLVADAVAAGVIEVRAVLSNVALICLARGLPPPADGLGTDSDGYEAVLAPLPGAVAAAAGGDAGSALDLVRPAVQSAYARHGLSGYFSLLWTAAVDWAVEAGRWADARDLIGIVERAGTTPVLRAHLARLTATVDAGDPVTRDHEHVEPALREAEGALAAIGYAPDLARVRLVLAGVLDERGRTGEAAALRAAARETLTALGAAAWLDAGVAAGRTRAG